MEWLERNRKTLFVLAVCFLLFSFGVMVLFATLLALFTNLGK